MPARPVRPSRTHEEVSKSVGRGSGKGTRAQAIGNAERANSQQDSEGIPRAADGFPLVKISMAAAELIPTGQFANISIGPALIEWYIDPRDDEPITSDQLSNASRALNQLAELVEVDVVAVQRNIVLESMQSQVSE